MVLMELPYQTSRIEGNPIVNVRTEYVSDRYVIICMACNGTGVYNVIVVLTIYKT